MKKGKFALFVTGLALLSSCGAPTSGTIEVRKLQIMSADGNVRISLDYRTSYSEVYIFEDADGKPLYVDTFTGRFDASQRKIKVRTSPYSEEYTDYNYVGFAGYLAQETRLFVDLDNRVVDTQVKWLEYKSDEKPESSYLTLKAKYTSKEVYDNVKKNGYYHCSESDTIVLGVTENGLELHDYIMYTEDCFLNYTLK